MKIQIFVVFVAFFAITSGVFVPPRRIHKKHSLDSKECTWGPSYWCQNLTAAANCNAVKHCIQTVWIYKQLAPDNSSICQTCLDMVKQARDQLESNETQELIKEVFEGSCALLHIKEIVKECDKLADEFIPELIDTLASQMNPQVVCSVAGLCNSERIHKLIEEEQRKNIQPKGDTCDGCHTVVQIVEDKFNKMPRDDVLHGFLEVCRKTGSFSDACSNIIITYFMDIYGHLKDNLNPNDFCLIAGECSAQFHTHANVEITPISHIGYVPIGKSKDDLPCELCEQLVGHLRDLLVANTTEYEFKRILEGICNQTKSFRPQCLSLVEEYYAFAYQFLVEELNSSEVCSLIGICPNNNKQMQVPIMPLLPIESVQKALEITPPPKSKPLTRINMARDGASVKIMETPEQAQLPIDILMPPHTQILYNSEVCVFCEYFLHNIQEVITSPKTEQEIKEIIDKACARLPSSVNETCIQFVDTYEPAFVAILAQEIDPSQVCPLIKACPSSQVQDVEIFMHQEGDGEKCPLCLFAVAKLEEMIKDKKTEDNIKAALSKLCSELPKSLAPECNDFVQTYTQELVEMLITDFTPQEVCVYLKLCSDNKPPSSDEIVGGDPNTNVIADNTINGEIVEAPTSVSADPQCILCEFVMKQIQDELKNNKTDDEIKNAVRHVCNKMPKTINKECNDFVDEYADTIIQLLIEATVPSEICRMIHLCNNQQVQMKVEIFECAVCESLVYAIEKILDNPKIDHDVEHVLEKACRALPQKEQQECKDIIEKYGKTIYNLLLHLANKGLVCKEIGLCAVQAARPNQNTLVGDSKCTWGPAFWCASKENAALCGEGARKHCERKVWVTRQKREQQLIGGNKCTWGPSHWCASEENARNCGAGCNCAWPTTSSALRTKNYYPKIVEANYI